MECLGNSFQKDLLMQKALISSMFLQKVLKILKDSNILTN